MSSTKNNSQLRYQLRKATAQLARAYLTARTNGNVSLAKQIKNCINILKGQLSLLIIEDQKERENEKNQ